MILVRLSWIFTFKHPNKICWTFSAIKSPWYLPVLYLLPCSFSPLTLCRQCQQWRCFPLKAPQNSFCLLLLFFHKWAIQQEERDDGWHSGTWMALCTWVPQQNQTACKAVSGVLCPKSSSSSHNKPFLWTKLIAEEKRTVNFDNHKPPIVSFQF